MKLNSISEVGGRLARVLAAVAGLAAVLAMLSCVRPARAAFAIYTNEADFVAALGPLRPFLNEFTNFTYLGLLAHPLYVSNSGVAYVVASAPPLCLETFDGAVSAVGSNSQVVVTFQSGNVIGVGGRLFSADDSAALVSGSVTLRLDDGTTASVSCANGMPPPFLGLLSDGPSVKWLGLTNNTEAARPALSHFYVVAGIPLVSIVSPTAGTLLVSWYAEPTGVVLQASSAVVGSAWTNVDVTPRLVGNHLEVSVPVSGSAQFFRIKKL